MRRSAKANAPTFLKMSIIAATVESIVIGERSACMVTASYSVREERKSVMVNV
jgi:hypothetical protein